MNIRYSITIEADQDGNLSFWSQSKPLTEAEKKRFEALKKRIEEMCRGVKQLAILEP